MTPSEHIICSDSTLRQALEALNAIRDGLMTLIVVDEKGRAIGTLTDGDVRRALLRSASLDQSVMTAANTRFHSLRADNPSPEEVKHQRRQGIHLLPVVDADGRLLRLLDLAHTRNILPIKAVVMAGGRGERLRPLTLTTPKPLLPVAGRPIIDYNVLALIQAGITDITVTCRYLASQIVEHFAQPVEGVRVRCVTEETATGTIGSASLAGPYPVGGCTLVMNSDLLTTLSFEDLYLHHAASGADVTIAALPYSVSVPYAILDIDSAGCVTGLSEKPTYSYYANAGIYIFANDLLASLPADRPTDATTLIEKAVADGRRVGYYPLTGTWIDIGTPTDYRQACDLMGLVNS